MNNNNRQFRYWIIRTHDKIDDVDLHPTHCIDDLPLGSFYEFARLHDIPAYYTTCQQIATLYTIKGYYAVRIIRNYAIDSI